MNDIVKNKYREITEYLKENTDKKNMNIDLILYDEKTKATYTIASDGYDKCIEFTPYTDYSENGYDVVPEWDFNFDYYVYDLLEQGCEIGYITDELHYNIWNSLYELYPDDIDCKDGALKYIEYCKKNNITKEYIDSKTGLDTPNIMDKFEDDKIRVLYVEPNKLPKEMMIDNTLEAKQHLVDGYIECTYLPNDSSVVLICNEEGKINGMRYNRDIGHDIIFGPFIIARDNPENGEFESLTDDQVLRYKMRFDKHSIIQTENKITAIKMSKMRINEYER